MKKTRNLPSSDQIRISINPLTGTLLIRDRDKARPPANGAFVGCRHLVIPGEPDHCLRLLIPILHGGDTSSRDPDLFNQVRIHLCLVLFNEDHSRQF